MSASIVIIRELQRILAVPQDGLWGPVTETALRKLIRQSTEAPPSPRPAAGKHPFVKLASPWMGTSETSRNRFDGARIVWSDTTYPDGWEEREPYCAAWVCHIVADAIRKGARISARPTSPSVSELRAWARRHGYIVSQPLPGDIFTLLPSGTSHTGIVESVKGGTIYSMEANTDDAGSRDGDGFWRKTRMVSKCDFFRIPLK